VKTGVILDTGPLVAFLNARDAFHAWALDQFSRIQPPLLTCESVLSEACFLLQGRDDKKDAVLELLNRGVLSLPFRLEQHATAIARLRRKYRDVPMSLADACLVRMTELHADSRVLTLDTDFFLYRKNGRQTIPCISPRGN
jgi:uncharacterized protein